MLLPWRNLRAIIINTQDNLQMRGERGDPCTGLPAPRVNPCRATWDSRDDLWGGQHVRVRGKTCGATPFSSPSKSPSEEL